MIPRRAHTIRLRTGRLWPSAAVAGLLTALCLALPTANATGDAWYYAACARWGQELWQPHHLLYNGIGWAWLRLVSASGAAGPLALVWLQMLNALAAGASLLALGRLLWRAGAPLAAIPAWLLLVGSCFGMLRFATENETYIQPLLLSLLASLAWARALYAKQEASRAGWLLLAGLLAALACLVHQLMVWWWLGLLLGLRPWRGQPALLKGFSYALPALLVPLAYALAAPGGGAAGVVRFALHDYLTGGARVEMGGKSLLFTGIGLVRTLGQVHGNLLPLLRRWPLPLGTVALASLGLGVYGALGAWWAIRATRAVPGKNEAGPPARTVRRTHALIGGLHVAFAVQATGNAEFMVMLPALAAVVLAGGLLRAWPPRRVAAVGAALLTWNLAFGLVPAHFLDYAGPGPVLRARVLGQPGAWFVLREPNALRNQLHYYTGRPAAPPRIMGLAGQDSVTFRRWLAGRLAAGDTVYTDALGGAPPFDRAQLAQGNLAARLLAGVPARRVDSLATFFGSHYVWRLGAPAGASQRPQ